MIHGLYTQRDISYKPSNTVDEVDTSDLVNEFSPETDPLWYILRKAEISFEVTRRVSKKSKEE